MDEGKRKTKQKVKQNETNITGHRPWARLFFVLSLKSRLNENIQTTLRLSLCIRIFRQMWKDCTGRENRCTLSYGTCKWPKDGTASCRQSREVFSPLLMFLFEFTLNSYIFVLMVNAMDYNRVTSIACWMAVALLVWHLFQLCCDKNRCFAYYIIYRFWFNGLFNFLYFLLF